MGELAPIWIDRRLQSLPAKPWRKIHLDYHNSQHIPSLADDFDPDEFVATLKRAHVDAVVVFGKDMHGYFYYPSDLGPVHPGLRRDLLGEQVKACREAGITVYGYYCTTWEHYLAERHPEWLVVTRERTNYLPKFDETPGYTALCLAQTDFIDLVVAQSGEMLRRYDVDGVWYDTPAPRDAECFCAVCLEQIRSAGGDPFDVPTQRAHKQQLQINLLRRCWEQAHEIRPGCQVDFNAQTRLGLHERAPYLDNLDIEALPTGGWGYFYYPIDVRYVRNFGKSYYGVTGRFHRSWADFGGLKHPNQLRTEIAAVVAHGAHAGIGDQPGPSCRLDQAAYDSIGAAYAEVEALQPYLEGAAPAVEAAVVVDGLPMTNPAVRLDTDPERAVDSVAGTVKLLSELHIQCDVADPTMELERYRLLVLPDFLAVSDELAARLRAFVAAGGAVIAAHEALRTPDGGSWAPEMGLRYAGESPYVPAYLVPDAGAETGLPDFEYALYDGTAQWTLDGEAEVLARVGEPLFQRSAEHYTSHGTTPFDHTTDYVAAARSGRVGVLGFPIGTSYFRHGYWPYRDLLRAMVDAVLPERLVRTTAPISAEVTVTHQAASEAHGERWMAHVVNFSANRRGPAHLENYEDPIPLTDVELQLSVPSVISRAYLAPDGPELPVRADGDSWHVVIPRVEISAVAVLEVES